MGAKRWGGAESRKARQRWKPLVNSGGVPCCRCGKLIVPRPWLRGDGWEPDHYPIPREFGGVETWPAHAPECNQSEGGKRGAEITNGRRRERREVENMNNSRYGKSARERGIRGV